MRGRRAIAVGIHSGTTGCGFLGLGTCRVYSHASEIQQQIGLRNLRARPGTVQSLTRGRVSATLVNVRILSFGCGVLLTGAVGLALGIIPDSGSAGEGKRDCCERFCVTVTPERGGKGTVFRFVGTGWRPNRRVRAVHGPYCEGDCPDIGLVRRVRTDRRGRWVFTFRHGPEQPGDREAGIVAGGNLSVFEQWQGKAFDSRLVRRRPPHKVE